MHPFVVGIAGGSGSGKSTVAFGLEDKFPGQVTVFHVDDYFKPAAEVPVLEGLTNWDDPEALYHEKMIHDLALLKAGQTAVINTKSPRLNPDFPETRQRIPVEFQPRPLIVVEGFLALHFPGLRQLLDLSVFLDAPFDLHIARRVHSKQLKAEFPDDYQERIIRPMHEKYVAPSKQYADGVIDVSETPQETVLEQVTELILQRTTLQD